MNITVKQINILTLDEVNSFKDQSLTLQGWIKAIRDSKNLVFIDFSDGTTNEYLQLIVKKDSSLLQFDLDTIKDLSIQTAVQVTGTLSYNSKAKCQELQTNNIVILASTDKNYLLQKKFHSLDFLRTVPQLRPQTKLFHAIFTLRSKLNLFIHQYFAERDFINITAPILTNNDAEGAGESFEILNSKDFFNKMAFLSVSGQLACEAYALAYKNVYTFGPTFRAEKSHTLRHIAEFYMIEPEVAFANLSDIIKIAFDILNVSARFVLQACASELKVLSNYHQCSMEEIINQIIMSTSKPFVLEYKDAIKMINDYVNTTKSTEIPLLNYGDDLALIHEKTLASNIIKKPVAITHYPVHHKPFYMKVRNSDSTVYCFDLLVPEVGELFGGSQRCDDYDDIVNNFVKMHPNTDYKNMQWYFDLRKYGYYQSAGFGLGFERLLMYLTKINNIKDVISFPRQAGQINF